VSGLFRAELLRLRKRRSLQIIVLGAPLLVAVMFITSYGSVYAPGPFDEGQVRADLIAQGYTIGLPPDEAERLLDEAVAQQRSFYDEQLESSKLTRANFAFPYSLAFVLRNGTVAMLAILILSATITGDEFGWGTIRTTLLASTHRRRILAVRLAALGLTALALFAAMLVLGAVLPLLIGVAGAGLPSTLPALDVGALGVLLLADLLVAATVIGATTLITLLVRNGALALAGLPVYLAAEAAVLALLLRFEPFGQDGDLAWLLDGFPLRGFVWLTDHAGRAATGLPSYPGEVFSRALVGAELPLTTLLVLAAGLTALAFRRFQRMDIAE
jgi:ABC-type transport system involved in multi-copper enzyme maturation permease subunit